jgi:hypothetical protein
MHPTWRTSFAEGVPQARMMVWLWGATKAKAMRGTGLKIK